jgi:hypothetical protein
MEGSAELRKTGFQLTWNQLKWIAIISMIIDHTSKVLFPQIFYIEQLGMDIKTSYMIRRLLPAVGRIAFPIFAFGIAQGCRVTRSPKRYLLRLALFAVISEVPYNLALNDMTFNFPVFAFHNVFFTLLIGAVCCRLSGGRALDKKPRSIMKIQKRTPRASTAERSKTETWMKGKYFHDRHPAAEHHRPAAHGPRAGRDAAGHR